MAITQKRFIAVLLATLMVFLNGFSVSGYAYGATDENAEDQTIASQSVVDGDQAQEPEADAEPAQEPEVTEEQVAKEEQKTVTQEVDVEEVKEVAFSQEKTVDGVKVKVTADRGVFPEGATLTVKKLNTKEAAAVEKAIGKISGEIEIAKQYNFDITILDKDGNEIQPEGKANVAFMTAEVADDSLKTEVYHIGDSGKAEAMDVASKGKTATVETEGFSAYALVFEHYDATGSTGKYSMAYGEEVALQDILTAVRITGKTIHSAEADSNAPLTVIGSGEETKVKMSTENPTGTDHSLTVRFTDGTSVSVTIHTHQHNWQLTADGNKATIKCTAADCPYTETYEATLSASDVTYDGQAHGAQYTGNMPSDVHVPGGIKYYSGSTLLTSEPVNAGTYRAEATISPDGGTAQTISTTYTIKKADINFTKEAAPISNLIYNGNHQNLYTLAAVKSATTSKTDFPIKYWYTDATGTVPTIDAVLTKKHADTYKISYQAVGGDNHNDSEVKTIEVTIGKRPVYFDGITAKNRIYNSKTNAELNYSQLNIHNVVDEESLTLTATGTFADKNVGTDKIVTLSDIKLAKGNDQTFASDYQVDMNDERCQKTTKATITPKTIEFDWENAENFQYNGQPQAPTPVKRPGNAKTDTDMLVYEGDDVTAGITDDSWQTEIGNNYEAKVTNLKGQDAGNYTLPDHDSHVRAKFNIVARVLEVEWTNTEVEYNGYEQKPTATLKTPVEGEDVQVVVTMDKTSKDAGNYTATASLTGEKASNYALNALTETTPFVIKKAPLTVKASGWIYYGDRVSDNESINELKYEIPDKSQFKGEDTQESVLGGTPRFETDYGSKYNLVDPVSDDTHKYYLFPHFNTAQNYEIDNEDGILTVYPKPVTLEWTHEHDGTKEDVSDEQAFTYDGKNHTYTAKVTDDSYVKVNGRNIDDEIEVTFQDNVQRDANAKTDTEKYTAKAATLSNKNYALVKILEDGKRTEEDVATRGVDFTIAQLPIELSWSPAEFTYNGQLQSPTHTIKNLQTNDEGVKDESFGMSVERKKTSTVFDEDRELSVEAGSWELTATNEADGLLQDANYTLKEGTGTTQDYVIKPLALKLKWTPTTRAFTYDTKEKEIKVELANVCAGDEDYVDFETSENSVFKGTDAGTYNIEVTDIVQKGEKDRVSNYTLAKETHPWKINPAPLTITAKARTITYGDNPANNGVTYSGFKGGEDKSVLTGSLKYKYNYAKYGKPGTYKITPYGLSAKNYKITYKQGNLKVNDKVNRIVAKGIAKGKRKGVITWNRVSGATSYTVYLAKCNTKGKKYTPKKVKTVKGTKYTTKKLKKNTFYKFYVVANTNRGAIKSYEGHFATGNKSGKATNPKKLKANKYTVKVSVGKTAKISGSVTKVQKKLKFHKQTPRVRFLSDNTAVATVSKGGVITGKAKGWTRVYVQAENGIWKTVQVYVR